MQKSVPEHTTNRSWKQIGYSSRRPQQAPTPVSQEEETEATVCTDFTILAKKMSLFLLWHLDDRTRHFRSLRTKWELFKHHSLPDYCYCAPIFWWLLPGGKHFQDVVKYLQGMLPAPCWTCVMENKGRFQDIKEVQPGTSKMYIDFCNLCSPMLIVCYV